MKYIKFITALIWLMLSFSIFAAQNAASHTEKTKKTLEILQQQIEAATLAIALNETSAGNNMADFEYAYISPEKQHVSLGILLDLNKNTKDYQVISVTPGSEAEKLGIKVKDLIQKINNTHIKNLSNTAVFKMIYDLVPNEELKLSIISEGTYKELSTIITGVNVPAVTFNIGAKNTVPAIESNKDNSCGIVSVFYTTSDAHKFGLSPVKFKKFNGLTTVRARKSLKLPIGKNKLYLNRGYSISSNAIFDGGAMPIEIDIQANTTYYLSAVGDATNSINTQIKRKVVKWKPVVWKIESRECEL